MKITICGSIAFYEKMEEVKKELEKAGHIVDLPPLEIEDEKGNYISVQDYYKLRKSSRDDAKWIWERKREAMKMHFDKIVWGDCILVLNYEKNDIKGYIGANTLMEMGLALHINKPIYLLNEIPQMNYREEILGMQPVILNGDLSKIK